MRTPRVRRVRGKALRRAPKPVPGGKALARLHQLERERDLAPTDPKRPKPRRLQEEMSRSGSRKRRAVSQISAYLEAFYRKERMSREAPAMPIQIGWRPLGPFCIPHGQTYGSGSGSRPSVAGRVSSVAVDPSDSSHILIGAAGGGVWETRDGGASWSPRTDDQPSLSVGAIAFDPSNPSIVYTGTGEGDSFSQLGVGLLRSTDGGTKWALHSTAPFAGAGFYDFVVDPLDPTHLLAATTVGLFESTNGGVAWTQRRTQPTHRLSMHPAAAGVPNSTQEIFAGCSDGVFRSTNGGTTWTSVSLPGSPATFQRAEVCHAPSDGGVVYVFAAGATGTGYLWRRSSAGGAFQSATSLPPDLDTSQAWYDWFAAVAPNNPDVLYLGAIDVHKGVRSATDTWAWETVSARTIGDSIHPDQHAIAFSPTDPNAVFVGNDGGVYFSPDGAVTWRSLNKGLCIMELEYLAQHPQHEAWLLGGTQDNGTQRYEGEEVWYHVQDGDGGDCGVSNASPYTCYHTFYGMGMERSTSGGGWGSWSWIGPNISTNYASLFYPPVEVNDGVVAQAGESVYVSTDTGTSWTQVALPAGAGVATALAIPSASSVYVGTSTGRVYRIDATGSTWQAPVALTRPRTGYVSDLLIDPTNPNRLWATYSNLTGSHVFRSDDAGASWSDVSGGLPAIPVNALVVDPANTDVVYAAADVGVYRSADAGVTWAAFSNRLPNTLVKDLVFHAPSRLLRAATQSRGVWEIAVDQAMMPDVEVYVRDSVVDVGRRQPSPSGVIDPFNKGSLTHWWECTDIKVDSPSYQTPLVTDVDFAVFEDDHGVFASGLIHESAQRSRVVRAFVQVHNRGPSPATGVAVKVFFANASVGLPNLPAGFWTGFPSNTLPATSPWQAIAPHQTISSIETARSEIVGFEWAVPSGAADHTCLLAVVTAQNDPVATTELDIGTLVLNNRRCGLKNLVVVSPPPAIGPRVQLVQLDLWGSRKGRQFSLGVDRWPGCVRGLVLPKRLAAQAQEKRLTKVKLSEEDQAALSNLLRGFPSLRKELDLRVAYAGDRRGAWITNIKLAADAPQPIVVLVDHEARRGRTSLVQWTEDEQVVGGFTFQRD